MISFDKEYWRFFKSFKSNIEAGNWEAHKHLSKSTKLIFRESLKNVISCYWHFDEYYSGNRRRREYCRGNKSRTWTVRTNLAYTLFLNKWDRVFGSSLNKTRHCFTDKKECKGPQLRPVIFNHKQLAYSWPAIHSDHR